MNEGAHMKWYLFLRKKIVVIILAICIILLYLINLNPIYAKEYILENDNRFVDINKDYSEEVILTSKVVKSDYEVHEEVELIFYHHVGVIMTKIDCRCKKIYCYCNESKRILIIDNYNYVHAGFVGE